MADTEKATPLLRGIRNKLVLSIGINSIVPLLVYLLLRRYIANDVTALAISMAIPIVRTVGLWVWRRRVDWIAVLAILGFAVALLISYLSGGSVLALELRGAVLAAAFGLVFLVSVVIRKPVIIVLLRVLKVGIPELSSSLDRVSSDPTTHQRFTTVTAAIGVTLLGKAVADLILALTLPTTTFLATSRIVNWIIAGSGLVFIWWTRQRVGGRIDGTN